MITIAAVETALIPIVGAMLTKVSLDGTTNSGSNADLRGPIRRAAVTLGVVPATPLILTDTDLSALADTKIQNGITSCASTWLLFCGTSSGGRFLSPRVRPKNPNER